MIREPCVAGQFYPADPETLKRMVEGYLEKAPSREKAVAVIVPHAGYIYSGRVAGEVFSRVEVPDDVVLIGPNHTGLGESVSVMCSGRWRTPIGSVEVNERLAGLLLDYSPLFRDDISAHKMEHSLEVELPFIQTINPKTRIVPITVMHADYKRCVDLGEALARALLQYDEEVLIVVSSDMNHYEPDDVTRLKDKKAIERILELDAGGLLRVARSENITMCGVVPASVALVAARELGAKKATLVAHTTSAETSGDYEHVVGYAGIIIS